MTSHEYHNQSLPCGEAGEEVVTENRLMNVSGAGVNLTAPTSSSRDNVQTAIVKNVITVIFCISINYVNSTLMHTFRKHQVFSLNPRYILYMHLVINDIILLTMYTLLQVLSYIVFTLNVSLCIFLLLFALFATINNPLTLAVMAVECYIAVCFPLHHTRLCTTKRTYAAIGAIWLVSSAYILSDLFAALATESVDFFHSRVFCLAANVFRQPYRQEKRKVSNIVLMVVVWLTLIYTYFRILGAAQAASSDIKKARNTVLLHGLQLLLCMLSYMYYIIIDGLLLLFPNGLNAIRYAVTVIIHVLPRLISPLVYGLRDKTFRKYLKMYLCCMSNTEIHPLKKT